MILLPTTTITTALALAQAGFTIGVSKQRPLNLAVAAVFNYGSGGTSVDAYIQGSFDAGVTWWDNSEFNFLLASGITFGNQSAKFFSTPAAGMGQGTLGANLGKAVIIGTMWRLMLKSSGTYAGGTTLAIYMWADCPLHYVTAPFLL